MLIFLNVLQMYVGSCQIENEALILMVDSVLEENSSKIV